MYSPVAIPSAFQSILSKLFKVIVVSVSLVLAAGANAQDSRQALNKLLEDDANLGGITGEFEIMVSTNPAVIEGIKKSQEEELKATGLSIVFEPAKKTLHCRWAWDGSREVMETLDGSNILRTFLSTREGFLEANSSTNFNLLEATNSGKLSPLQFYHGFAPKRLKEFSLRDDVKSDGRTLHLTSKENVLNVSLSLDDRGRISKSEIVLGGKVKTVLQITSYFEHADGRAFPRAAIIVRHSGEKFLDWMTMRAVSIRFPSEVDLEMAMNFEMPQNSEVYDRMLNTVATYPNGTTARDSMKGNIRSSD